MFFELGAEHERGTWDVSNIANQAKKEKRRYRPPDVLPTNSILGTMLAPSAGETQLMSDAPQLCIAFTLAQLQPCTHYAPLASEASKSCKTHNKRRQG